MWWDILGHFQTLWSFLDLKVWKVVFCKMRKKHLLNLSHLCDTNTAPHWWSFFRLHLSLSEEKKSKHSWYSLSKIVLFIKAFFKVFIADEFFQSSCIFMSDTWHFYSDFEGGVNSNATTQKSCLFLNANEMEIFFRLDRLLS